MLGPVWDIHVCKTKKKKHMLEDVIRYYPSTLHIGIAPSVFHLAK